ncbi:MAG: hypothetical protein M3Y91_17110, partial [Actinomycetota bacterium]|nr:hypothetical protein [Actinomycetota bacterium]
PTSVPGVDLEVYELQRESPQAVLVVFALHVVGSSSIGIGDQTSTQEELDANLGTVGGGPGAVSGVSIVDLTGLKQYLPYMSDPTVDSTCLCSQNQFNSADSGDVDYFAAVVAAPPAGVTTVSFQTGLGTIGNLPLSGSGR